MNLFDRELYNFLEEKHDKYNTPAFTELDPISIAHGFTLKEDIEISAFLIATIAWGRRDIIIKNGQKLMNLMGNSPYDFVMSFGAKSGENLSGFKHRTFNEIDLHVFIKCINNIYLNHNGLQGLFTKLIQAT